MEPAGGFGPFGGPGRRGEGPRLGGPPPGGFLPGGRPSGDAPRERPPGSPGGFGPGMFLAPTWVRAGDADRDGRLNLEEFRRLAGQWFEGWDTNRSEALSAEEARAGLNRELGGPRGPGGPPGRGPGLNLQGREGQRNGLAAALGIDFPTVKAELEFEGHLFPAVSVRYKGNGTFLQARGTLKRSLKLDLNDVFPRQKLAGVSKLNLHNCVTDASWMNEVLAHRLFRDAGVPAPRTAYARVFLTVPGEHDRRFLGLYSLVENPDRDFAEAQFGTRKGALFKPVTPRLFEDLGDDWAAYRQTYDPKTPVSEEETRRVIAFSRLVSHAGEEEFARAVGDYLDLDNFARFMAVTVWVSTLDSLLGPGQNYLVHLHPVTRRFQFIPWDLDHAFGQFPLIGTQEQREHLSLWKPWQGQKRFLERVFAVPAFRELYLQRLTEFNRTIFRPERLIAQVDELAAALRPVVAEESAEKLARFDQAVSGRYPEPEWMGGFGRGPGRGGFPGAGQALKPIRTFVPARWQSVEDQLAGRAGGLTLEEGFGPGGRGPGGGPGNFEPGNFLGPAFLAALDANRDGELSRAEMEQGFARWFAVWDANGDGRLDEPELRDGLNTALGPGVAPGGPGGDFSPEPGRPLGPRTDQNPPGHPLREEAPRGPRDRTAAPGL